MECMGSRNAGLSALVGAATLLGICVAVVGGAGRAAVAETQHNGTRVAWRVEPACDGNGFQGVAEASGTRIAFESCRLGDGRVRAIVRDPDGREVYRVEGRVDRGEARIVVLGRVVDLRDPAQADTIREFALSPEGRALACLSDQVSRAGLRGGSSPQWMGLLMLSQAFEGMTDPCGVPPGS
ncbi:MAG: hypothetical protein Kow0062_18790 [Acidobacteriota bacterium]